MAERVIYSCDFCTDTGGVLKKNQFAVERLLVRSLTSGNGEFNLDVCQKHLDRLKRSVEEGPRTAAKKVAAKLTSRKQREAAAETGRKFGGATYVKSTCDKCGREFPTKQGLTLHMVRTGHGRPKGAPRGGSPMEKKEAVSG